MKKNSNCKYFGCEYLNCNANCTCFRSNNRRKNRKRIDGPKAV